MKNKIKEYRTTLLLTSVIILLPIVFGLLLWKQLPDAMPIHWDATGNVNGYAGKAMAVFAMPLILLTAQWLMVLLTLKEESNKTQNPKIMLLVFWLLPLISTIVHAFFYATALHMNVPLLQWEFILLGFMYMMVGNYLPKAKPNRTIGVRLPWTLSDETNWYYTHRFTGKVWMVCGLLVLCLSFAKTDMAVIGLLSIIIISIILPTFYSYLFYRKHKTDATYNPQVTKISKISILFIVLTMVFVVWILNAGKISYTVNDTSLRINASFYKDIEIPYDSISTVTYEKDGVSGTRTNGFGSLKLLLGEFENDDYGYYTRYTYTKVDPCIVLTSNEGNIMVINAENEEETVKLYDQLVDATRLEK